MDDHVTAAVVPTGTALGAEIRGVDLKRLDDRGLAAILAACDPCVTGVAPPAAA